MAVLSCKTLQDAIRKPFTGIGWIIPQGCCAESDLNPVAPDAVTLQPGQRGGFGVLEVGVDGFAGLKTDLADRMVYAGEGRVEHPSVAFTA